MSEKAKDGERFEDQLAKLEEIVARLEDESVGLEEALDLFEGGMELARFFIGPRLVLERNLQLLLENEDDEEAADEEAE